MQCASGSGSVSWWDAVFGAELVDAAGWLDEGTFP
jgi:hypothetical protein